MSIEMGKMSFIVCLCRIKSLNNAKGGSESLAYKKTVFYPLDSSKKLDGPKKSANWNLNVNKWAAEASLSKRHLNIPSRGPKENRTSKSFSNV